MPHTHLHTPSASFHPPVSHRPLSLFEEKKKKKVLLLANLSIRMLSCCGDDGGPRRPTIHLQQLAGSMINQAGSESKC